MRNPNPLFHWDGDTGIILDLRHRKTGFSPRETLGVRKCQSKDFKFWSPRTTTTTTSHSHHRFATLKRNDDTAILHNVSKETAIRVSFDKEKKTEEDYNAAASCYQFKRPLKEQNMSSSKRSEIHAQSREREEEEEARDLLLKLRIARLFELHRELAVCWQAVVDDGVWKQADGQTIVRKIIVHGLDILHSSSCSAEQQ